MRQVFLAGIAGGSLPPFLAILAFFLISTGAVPQQQPDLSSFVESIDVRVINLEVVVIDRGGNRVTDLRPEDFQLIVDQEEVAIDYFSEIRQRQAVSPRPAAKEGSQDETDSKLPPDRLPAPAVDAGETVATNFLLFVDNFFGIQRDRNRILRKLHDDLPLLSPNDRMAVVSFDGRELDLVGPWSSAPETIAENLHKAMEQPALGLQRRTEQSFFDSHFLVNEVSARSEGWSADGRSSGRSQKTALAVDRVQLLSGQLKKVIAGATASLRSFASLPGRKVMLLMSGGWPRDLSLYTVGMDAKVRAAGRRHSLTKFFEDLIHTANLLGYTIYPIDMPGLQVQDARAHDRAFRQAQIAGIAQQIVHNSGPGTFDGREEPPDSTSATLAEESMAASTRDFYETVGREHEIEASLLVMAQKTGGLAMINGFREVALSKTLQDVGSYYWLGFTPDRQRDDEQHSIRVEILRPGLKARSRRGFSDFSRATAVTMMVESQLLFSTDLGNQALGVEMGPPQRRRRRELQVPVSLRIPLDGVVMLPVDEGFEAQLELRVAAIDKAGNRSEIPVIPIRLGGATPPPAGAFAAYDTELLVRPHTRRLVLAVHDVVGEGILTTSLDLDSEPGASPAQDADATIQ
ncbi:MAG: VWA domain-containing protein [bacterium]|nr:VWA domain-containing protein [bacterium]